MAKVGISLKIDVSKIEKDKLFKGKSGVYLDCTAFVDLDNQDQYGNNGMITQKWKDSQDGKTPILGNSRVFWREDDQSNQGQHQRQPQQQSQPQQAAPSFDDEIDDIPF